MGSQKKFKGSALLGRCRDEKKGRSAGEKKDTKRRVETTTTLSIMNIYIFLMGARKNAGQRELVKRGQPKKKI